MTAQDWNKLDTASKIAARCAYLPLVSEELSANAQTLQKAWGSSQDNVFSRTIGSEEAEKGALQQLFASLFFINEELKNQKIGTPAGLDTALCNKSPAPCLDREELTKMFLGMSSLLTDELAGERMYVGYESQSQEDEHSCFSDMTHLDIIENVQGVINVWTGDYGTSQGPGLDDLVAAANPALARKITRQLQNALAAAQALPTPYDSLLIAGEDSEERKILLDTILTIQDAGTAVKEGAEALGLSVITN